nr:uncharacterized protein LOC111508540 isoform X1 [Leptinotarsa decemlineata]
MANSMEKYGIFQFDGKNFDNWKLRMEKILDQQEVKECIESEPDTPSEKFTKNDKKCKSIIFQCVSNTHLEYIKEKPTSYQMWTALNKVFQKKAGPSKHVYEMENVMACSSDSYAPECPCKNLKFTKINKTTKSLSFDLELKRPFDKTVGGILELEKWTPEGWRKLPFIPMIPDACRLFLRYYKDIWSNFMRALGVKHPDRCPIPAGNYSMKQHVFSYGGAITNSFPFKGRCRLRSLMVDLKTKSVITCLEMMGNQDILVE